MAAVGEVPGPAAGRGRDRPRWRDLAVVGVAVVGLLAALVVSGGDGGPGSGPADGDRRAGRSGTEAAEAGAGSVAGAAGAAGSLGPVASVWPLPDPPLPGPTGTVLLVTGGGEVRRADLDRAQVAALDHPDLGRADQPPVARAGAVVVQDDGGAVAVPAPFEGEGRPLGPAEAVLPAADPGRVWLLNAGRDGASAVEVDLAGRHTVAPFAVPSPARPVGAVEGGLVVEAGGTIVVVGEAGRPERVLGPGLVVATSPHRVARMTCDPALDCALHVDDLATGATLDVPLPHPYSAFEPAGATFSPDGARLSVLVRLTRAREQVVGIVDTRTGSTQLISHPPFLSTAGSAPAWSPSGEWLFFPDATGEVMAVRAADGEVFRLDVDVTHPITVTAVAAG